jgi:hypothetical protein
MSSRILTRSLVMTVMLLIPAAWAQTTNGTIVGDVTDASGGAVPEAKISVKNKLTGAQREAMTDAVGAYRVAQLLPGNYEVSIQRSGFRTQVIQELVLEVAATVKLDFRMDVGQVTETVNVDAAIPVLQTQEASTGNTVNSFDVARLPVNGRNYTRLILLMPGSSDQGSSQTRGTDIQGTSLISVNGQRRQDNNLTLDGVDNNFMMMNSPGLSPPMDSLQEFKVATNNSAEFGRSAGANVNMVVKGGSQRYHGSFYNYLRNNIFDANDFFANRNAQGKVPFRQNQYGMSFGGPIRIPKLYDGSNKTFFFVNWEGFRRRRGSAALSTSPVEAQRNGDFSQLAGTRPIFDPLTSQLNAQGAIVRQPFANNTIPAARISPAIRLLVSTYMPVPNRPGLINNLVNTQSQANDRDTTVMRFDHIFSQKDTVFVRYLYQKAGLLNPAGNPNFFTEGRFDGHNIAATWNHTLSSASLLEVKFGYNNPSNPSLTYGRQLNRADFLSQAGIRMFQTDVLSSTVPPNFNASGEFSVGGGGDVTADNIWQSIVNYSTIKGSHSLKMGANHSRRHFFTNTANPMNGDAIFDPRLTNSAGVANSGHSYATMLLGFPTEVRRGQGNTLTQGRINAPQFYFQDDWRVTNKLTLNMGLRYEFQNAPYDTTDRLGNLAISREADGRYVGTLLWAATNPEIDPTTGLRNQPAKQGGYGRALMRSDYNNYAPRFGFAFQANNRTVVRGAYGIFYNSTFVQELQDLRKFWPFTVQQVFTPNTGLTPDLSIVDSGPSFNNTAAIGGWPQNPENRTPYSQQWNLTIQQQIMNDMSLEVGYVGNGNRKQVGYTAINGARPGPGDVQPRRLLPNFGDIDGGSNRFTSNYHAFQTTLRKRFSNNLQFNANYTWGKVLDYQSSLAEWKTQDPLNIRADYSRASIDVRHVVNVSYLYDLPFGRGKRFGSGWNSVANAVLGNWSVDGFFRAQTGRPYNVTLGRDGANIGRSYQRPDVLRNPNEGPKIAEQWFDRSAFVSPAPFTFGSAGAFIVEGDGRHNYDISIGKKFFPRGERQNIEFRAEMFNLSNTTKFGDPVTNFSASNFGTVNSRTAARQIQFALRYSF